MAADNLGSWSNGPVKTAILDFIARVTCEGGPDFVAPERRIACFDNDGTLWCERPLQAQAYFADFRLQSMVSADPSLKDRQPYKAFLERNKDAIMALGKKGILEFLAAVHAGMTEDEFAEIAADWLSSAENPQFGKRFVDLVYRPQLELLDLLRANGFACFIVSAGGADFMRAISESAYGIDPAQVIGSSVKTRFELRDGRGVLVKEPAVSVFNDREVKSESIGQRVGRRPILAFGNSDGDLAMLRYALTGGGPSLGLLLHHDDAEREDAYDREFILSPLVEALDKAEEYGITLVSMEKDWTTVFP